MQPLPLMLLRCPCCCPMPLPFRGTVNSAAVYRCVGRTKKRNERVQWWNSTGEAIWGVIDEERYKSSAIRSRLQLNNGVHSLQVGSCSQLPQSSRPHSLTLPSASSQSLSLATPVAMRLAAAAARCWRCHLATCSGEAGPLPLAAALGEAAGEAEGEAAAERGDSTGAAAGLEGRERCAALRCGSAATAEEEGSPHSMGITRGWALGCCCWPAGGAGAGLAAWQQQVGHACSACGARRGGGRWACQ